MRKRLGFRECGRHTSGVTPEGEIPAPFLASFWGEGAFSLHSFALLRLCLAAPKSVASVGLWEARPLMGYQNRKTASGSRFLGMDYQNMNEEQLAAALDQQVRSNTALNTENTLLETFLNRHGAADTDFADAGGRGRDGKKKTRRSSGGGGDDGGGGPQDGGAGGGGGKSRRSGKGRGGPTALTMQQKNDVATQEADAVQKEIVDTRVRSEKLLDTLRSVIEETAIRLTDLKKDAYEFKRDIVVGAENFRTGKTMAEKVVRYMEEKLRQKDAMVEKLKLKNQTLKTQLAKVDAQLRQKEEMGDVLHYIDFHQLQIENKQYVAKIEERNQELLKLKMTTGSTVQVLNSLKKQLGDIIAESDWLRKEIGARSEMLKRIKRDNISVNDEIMAEKKRLGKFRSAREETEGMPQVIDYVNQKRKEYEVEAKIKNWGRKIEIAEMEARRLRKQRQRQGAFMRSAS